MRVSQSAGRIRSLLPYPLYAAILITGALHAPPVLSVNTREAPEPVIQASVVDQTDVFVSGENGYHTYRIPSLLRAADGTLLAFCEGRKQGRGDSGDIDLVLKRLEPGGSAFGEMVIVWDDGPNTCGNPCPVLDRETGTIWLWLTHNLGEDREPDIVARKSRGTRTVWLTHSRDNGKTWAKPIEMTQHVKLPEWSWYATGPGCGIQTRSGRLVVPCDHIADDGTWGSHVILSDDHGQTWRLGGITKPKTNECEVVELSDGRLLLNMRNYNRQFLCRAVAESTDGGLSWSEVRYDETLIEPVCQASIRRVDGMTIAGRPLVAFSNPADPKERRRMTVRFSADDCRSWPWSAVIWEGPAAYSCLGSLPDGTVLLLYERGEKHAYERISLARIVVKMSQEKPQNESSL